MASSLWIILFLVFLSIIISSLKRSRNKCKNLPPSPPALPILGHLHLLKRPIHICFNKLSKKYGPVFFLKLGSIPTFVVSSLSSIEECFTKNEVVLANRPGFLIGKHLLYNFTAMPAANYGHHWRNLRRVCATEIFSSTRLSTFMSGRWEEVNRLIRRVHRACRSSSLEGSSKVELRSMFMDMNFITRMVARKQYFGEDIVERAEKVGRFKALMTEFFEFPATNFLSDVFPVLQSVDYDGFIKKLVRLGIEEDTFFQELIEEQRKGKGANTTDFSFCRNLIPNITVTKLSKASFS